MTKIFAGVIAMIVLITIILCPYACAITGVGADTSCRFYDLDCDAWYYKDVIYVYEHGIMVGVSDRDFLPDGAMTASMSICSLGRLEGMEPIYRHKSAQLTRQEFARILYLYITAYRGYTINTSEKAFSDDYDIAGFAKQAVYSLKEAGILCGYQNGAFLPERTITRAEAAAMIHRMCEWMEGAGK